MEKLSRRVVLLCELGLLCVAAFLSARLVNGLIAERLASGPRWSAPQATRPPGGEPPRLSLPALEALFPQARAAPAGPTEPLATPAAGSLRQRLLGTLVANRREWSMASIRDERSATAAVLMEGDALEGRRVLRIERWRVLLDSGEELALDSQLAAGPGPGAGTAVPPAALPGIRQSGAGAFSVERDWLERTLADPRDLTTGVRIVPAFEDGRAVGFKFFSMRQGSAFASLGLQNGDVVRRINGLELSSPERALEAYAALRTANRFEVELTRAGQPVRQQYQVGP